MIPLFSLPKVLPNKHRLLFVVLWFSGIIFIPMAQAQTQPALTVEIIGIDDNTLKSNVEIFLQIKKLTDKSLPSETRLRWLHEKADEDIRRALQPFGYYKPQIHSNLQKTASGWEARYQVDPGQPIRIGSLDVTIQGDGTRDPRFQDVLEHLPLVEGETLEHTRYEDLKQDLQKLATEYGYFDAKMLKSQIRVDLQAYQAGIVLHFDTGKRYSFGEAIFNQDALDLDFLKKYVDFQPGDPYKAETLLKLQSDLIDSEYFEQVEIDTTPDKAVDYRIPVDIDLAARKKYKFKFGLGYGTDTGIRGSATVEQRRVNRRGHKYRTTLTASQIKYGLAGEYIIPGEDPRKNNYAIRLNALREDSDVKDTFNVTAGLNYRQKDVYWDKIYSLEYLYETFKFSGEKTTTVLLLPSAKWTFVSTEDRLNVADGYRLNMLLRGSLESALSDTSFLQGDIRGKWIKSFSENSRLIVRGDFGSTLISNNNFDDLPATLRFYAGGDNSVRGYKLDEIGPRNEEGDVIGGKHLAVGSLEYEHRVLEKWSIAAFIDSGDAFNDNSFDPKTGVGIGVRWASPVGPVRIDVASGLDRPPGDKVRLHLNIGPDL